MYLLCPDSWSKDGACRIAVLLVNIVLKSFSYLLINYYCSEIDPLHIVVTKILGGLCHSASYISGNCLHDWLAWYKKLQVKLHFGSLCLRCSVHIPMVPGPREEGHTGILLTEGGQSDL